MNTMRSIRKSTKFSSLLPNMNLIRIFEILKKNPGKSKNTYNLVQDEYRKRRTNHTNTIQKTHFYFGQTEVYRNIFFVAYASRYKSRIAFI